MPKKLEKCVEKVEKTVKPKKKGQTKESAAYAICTTLYKTGKLK